MILPRHRRLVLAILLACAAAAGVGWSAVARADSSQGLADTPWPMFQHDLQHTGQSPLPGPLSNTVKWKHPGPGRWKGSPAIGSDGTIYVGIGWTPICAFDPSDGTQKWCTARGGDVSHSSPAPAVAVDGTVYLGSRDNKLWSVNGTTGQANWKYVVHVDGDVTGSPAIGPDGTIYTISACPTATCPFINIQPGFGLALAVNPDGTTKWQLPLFGLLNSSPALSPDAGTVYLTSRDGVLHALKAAGDGKGNGVELWTATVGQATNVRFAFSRERVSSATIGPDGTIYVGAVGGVSAVRPSDGSVLWTFPTPNTIVLSTPALDGAGNLFFGTTGGTFYKIRPQSPQLLWSKSGFEPFVYGAALDSRGNVYVGATKTVLALNGQDGSLLWSLKTRGRISSAAIGAGQILYVSSQDRYLYAIGP